MWPRRTAWRSSSPTAKEEDMPDSLLSVRSAPVRRRFDATWKTQMRLAVLGFLQLVCDLVLPTRKLAATEVLSHAHRTLGDACTPGHK